MSKYFAYAPAAWLNATKTVEDLEPQPGDVLAAKQHFDGCEVIPPRMALEVVRVEAERIVISPVFRTDYVIGTFDPENFILLRRASPDDPQPDYEASAGVDFDVKSDEA
jgi:hypothetical protein